MENKSLTVTVQGVINPVPAAPESVNAGFQSSISSYRKFSTPVAHLAGLEEHATGNHCKRKMFVTDNPFRRNSGIQRSPPLATRSNTPTTTVEESRSTSPFYTPTSSVKTVRTPPPSEKCEITEENVSRSPESEKRLTILKFEEEKLFIELGKKLSIANAVLINAKNVHKPIRDNLTCAAALYQQLKEYRDAISKNPVKQTDEEKQTLAESKYTQTDCLDVSDMRSKRMPSVSPECESVSKKLKTTDTEEAPNHETESQWKNVDHRKKNRKKTTKTRKNRNVLEVGEALTISTSNDTTYAEMLKCMKENIDPTELGVQVNEMRRTKAGELLIKLKGGEGKAELLKEVILNTLGGDATVRAVTKNTNIDIRDMDESTEKEDILNALKAVSGLSNSTSFKILNIRETYGKTKQAKSSS